MRSAEVADATARSPFGDASTTPRASRPRYAVLDSLRFVAAIMVLTYHFTARQSPAWGAPVTDIFPSLSALTKYGAVGVQCFFVVSGFVILMTAWGRSREGYVASRISRLYPAYWVCVLLTTGLLTVLWPGQKSISVRELLVNLTMTQEGFGVSSVDGVYWTLWVELKFYVIILILMTVGITYKRILVFAAVWPVLSGVVGAYDNSGILKEVLLTNYAPFFAAGMTLFLIARFGHSLIAWLVLLANVAYSTHVVTGFARTMERSTGLEISDNWVTFLVLTFYILVGLAVLSPIRRVRWRWLTWLGLLTYPLYLLHEYWGWFFISRLHLTVPPAATLVLAVLAVLLMAWLVVRCVERPFASRLRKVLQSSLEAIGGHEGRSEGAEPQAGEPPVTR